MGQVIGSLQDAFVSDRLGFYLVLGDADVAVLEDAQHLGCCGPDDLLADVGQHRAQAVLG